MSMTSAFIAPTITDYGSLAELTAALGISGPEDGATKSAISHVTPSLPIIP
jgi:hypothetical protein